MRQALIFTIALLVGLLEATNSVAIGVNDGLNAASPGGHVPDFSGAYVENAEPSKCSLLKHSSGNALHIAQSGGTMTLRVLSSGITRVLRIESPTSASSSARRRNGLARWEDNWLVVKTSAPAFPLWGRFGAVAIGSSLIEGFSRTAGHLLYRVWLSVDESAEPLRPVETKLVKCVG